jgi:hypothetical protein
VCEQKRRWDDRDRPANRIAFQAWSEFYRRFQPSSKKKTYKDFSTSNYYGGFVKFGLYSVEAKVVNPLQFTMWLINANVPLDNWNSDRIYDQYLLEYTQLEAPMDAVKRSIDTLLTMSEDENILLRDSLRLLSANKICFKVTTGHISPWLLYNCDSGIQFLSELNQSQQQMIYKYIDTDIWQIKFKRNKDETTEVQTLLKTANL